jgi:hypothetical protein
MKRKRLFQASSESQSQRISPTLRRTLFGPPLLLDWESSAAYDELFARIWEAVKPADFIEEMFTVDVVSLEFEVLRWRRLKLSMMRKRVLGRLEDMLRVEARYPLYLDYFVNDLSEILERNLPKDEVNSAHALAQQFAQLEEQALVKVNNILAGIGLRMERLLDGARDRKVNELVKEYARRESTTMQLIDEILSGAGTNMDVLMAEALERTLDYVERIDRLTTIAEDRRNAMLREIDHRRPILAEALRQTVQQIEHEELEVVKKGPADEENVA